MRALALLAVGGLGLGCAAPAGTATGDRQRPTATSAGAGAGAADADGRPAAAAGPEIGVRSVDPPAGAGAMAPNVAEAPGGEALLTWLEPAGESHRLRFSRFAGGVWSAPVSIAEGPRMVASWADVPSVAETSRGVLVATWAEAPRPGAHAYDVAVARSTDRGATWRRLGAANDDRTDSEHGFVSLVAEGGHVRAFWLDGRDTVAGGATTLRTALVGPRIEPSRLLDPRVCDCCSTAAVAGEGGALLAYRDRGQDEVRDIAVVTRADAAGAWSAPRSVHRDGWRIAGCPVNGPAAAARGRNAAVAWYTDAAGRPSVRAAFSADGGASFAPAVEIDGPAGPPPASRARAGHRAAGGPPAATRPRSPATPGDPAVGGQAAGGARAPIGRVGLVVEASGEALVAWMATAGDRADVLVRRVARDGRLGPERRIARMRAGRGTGVPRIASLGGGKVLLAWTEPGPPSRVRALLLPGGAIAPIGEGGRPAVPSASEPAGPVPGERAPAYAAQTLDGRRAALADLRGRVVLLDFWATWCVPCRGELDDLARLHRRRAADGLSIVAVSLDDAAARAGVAAFVRRRRLPFAVWFDPDDRASPLFGVRALPTSLLLGRDGTIRWRRDGVTSAGDPELGAALDAALREPAGPAQRSGP